MVGNGSGVGRIERGFISGIEGVFCGLGGGFLFVETANGKDGRCLRDEKEGGGRLSLQPTFVLISFLYNVVEPVTISIDNFTMHQFSLLEVLPA